MEKILLSKIPTPIQQIDLPNNNFYVKRDDMTDLAFGGNKARKLEYFMGEIVKNKYSYIVTYGSTQSNHCRITAAAASKAGIPCLLILAKGEKYPEYNGNYFLYDLFDAEIVWSPVENVSQTINEELKRLRGNGHNPYFIPGGGHSPLGTHAYVEAYKEIEQQRRKMDITFDYIFFATGTGTTQAGLIIGNKLLENKHEKVVGISVARRKERGKQVIKQCVSEYIKIYNLNLEINNEDILFEDSYIGDGYGEVYLDVLKTIKMIAKCSGIILDPVYTGKAFWGMLDYLTINNIKNKNVLFIHTGGTPLVFIHSEKFIQLKGDGLVQ